MVFFVGFLNPPQGFHPIIAEMCPSEVYSPIDTLRLRSYFTVIRDFTLLVEV
jgi:hypothetical protein